MQSPFFRKYFDKLMEDIEYILPIENLFFKRIDIYLKSPCQSTISHWFNDNSAGNGYRKIKRSGTKTAQLTTIEWQNALTMFKSHQDFAAVDGSECVSKYVLSTINDPVLSKRHLCGVELSTIATCRAPLEKRAMVFVGIREHLDGCSMMLSATDVRWIKSNQRPHDGIYMTEMAKIPWHNGMFRLANNKFRSDRSGVQHISADKSARSI